MDWKRNIANFARLAGEATAETLWPTRCALCDLPGVVLCERCRRNMPYVDWWRACKRCGSPYGRVQCDLCNPVMLGRLGLDALPFDACASAVHYCGDTGQIVRVFKDQGEQRLAHAIAATMARVVPPNWHFDAVAFVPATLAAFRNRGYDHGELLAQSLAASLGAPCIGALARPRTLDQRALGAAQRIRNLAGSFRPLDGRQLPERLLLIDDVFTTGATLCAASRALKAAGVAEVRCLTFARV